MRDNATSAVALLLRPLSWLYGLATTVRNKFFDWSILSVTRLDLPVLSVGNLTVGGTGKTPLVEYIVQYLLARRKTVAVISRGYKRETRGFVIVSEGSGPVVNARQGGDEPVQLARRFPQAVIAVGERRVEAARILSEKFSPDVFVLDDAFQHRSLGRSLDILVLESTHDITREPLLPAGRMREPLQGIGRAELVCFSHAPNDASRAGWQQGLGKWYAGPIVRCRHRHVAIHSGLDDEPVEMRRLEGKTCVAFSGIGRHERFVEQVKEAGLRVVSDLRFPDHHYFTQQDLSRITGCVQRTGAEICLTTEKDIVRLAADPDTLSGFMSRSSVYYLSIEMEIVEGENILQMMIDSVTGVKVFDNESSRH